MRILGQVVKLVVEKIHNTVCRMNSRSMVGAERAIPAREAKIRLGRARNCILVELYVMEINGACWESESSSRRMGLIEVLIV